LLTDQANNDHGYRHQDRNQRQDGQLAGSVGPALSRPDRTGPTEVLHAKRERAHRPAQHKKAAGKQEKQQK
jgi:hypothetical protein